MLPFFRKIRWRLASGNDFFKYSRYAVGEIVLVVIGILIALQVNNWNESRLERENELFEARDLYLELLESEEYLSQTLELWERRNEYIQVLSDTLVADNMEIGQRAFDSLLVGALSFRNFSPTEFSIEKSSFHL